MEYKLDEKYKTVEKIKVMLGLVGLYISWMLTTTIVIGIMAISNEYLLGWFGLSLGLLVGVAFIIASIAFAWINRNYQNFRIRLGEKEILINEGVITKTDRHIPYGRIQNLNIHRGPLQRRYGIATLKIETAGFSASSSSKQGRAEGIIPGIRNPEAIIEYIHPKLGHVKEGLVAGAITKEKSEEFDVLTEINENLKQIRDLIERKG